MDVLKYPYELINKEQFSFFDDFFWYVTAHSGTTTASDSGTVAVADGGTNGILVLTPSDGTVADNDEAYFESTIENLKFAENKPIYARASIQFSEANTDDANVFFGVLDAVAANTLVDDGAGMKTSFSGACIYKVDGGTVWKCVTSNSTTQTISTSTTTAGGSSYQDLEIIVNDFSSTQCQVLFKCDGQYLRDSNNIPIKHYVNYSSATDMQVGFGVKNGGTNLETLNVDWYCVVAKR